MESRGRQLLILITGNFFLTLGYSIIMPILPYYSKSMGATALDLGLLLASWSVMQFVATPIWGEVSDRIGRRPVFLIGMFSYGVSFLIYGVATQLWMLFAARALGGLLCSGIYPASLAYIADVTEPQERGKVMGLLGAASAVGMIFGPSVGGVLAVGGLAVPFFATAAASVAFGALGYGLLKEWRAVSVHRLRHRIRIADPLRTPIGPMFLLMMLTTFLITCFQGVVAYYMLGRFGMAEAPAPMPVLWGTMDLTGPAVMTVLFTIMGIAGVLCQGILVGRAIAAFGERQSVFAGLIVSAASFFLLLLAPELITLALFACALSVGTGLMMPCLNALVSRHTREDRQGAMMGVLGSYASLGRIAGPPTGGFAYDINTSLPFLIAGALSAAGVAGMALSDRLEGVIK